MSEPKLISPLLDNFAMGDPMSSHHGVRCCPAMENDSDKKYIVKVISIPASQVQLEALLLTGAYNSDAAALSYFRDLAEGVVKEAKVLQKLSKLEGFLPYESWQIVQMDNAVGYDVYLLSSYKRSLERFFRKESMTQLGAVNLGLDLCAAMAVCRRTGMLYVDLKPGNIYISADNEYRIGDLGFIPLTSLKYASLPDKYRSVYTPPEIKDAYSSLNETMDTYAIGLILYQAYNNGQLPFSAQRTQDPLPPPMYADYEMAEIIMKAIAMDPSERWQDPIAMGQALVSYMQRNGANDEPLAMSQEKAPEQPRNVESEQVSSESMDEAEQIPDAGQEEEPECSEADTDQSSEENSEEAEEGLESSDLGHEDPELAEIIKIVGTEEEPPEEADVEPDAADLSFMEQMTSDETAPAEDVVEQVSYEELTEDASDILAQADELISHETPAPAVAPDPVDVPIPEPLPVEPAEEEPEEPEENTEEELSEEVPDDEETVPDAENNELVDSSETDAPETAAEPKKKKERSPEEIANRKRKVKRITISVFSVILAAALLFGAYYYYQNVYLRNVSGLTLTGSENQLVVQVVSDAEESLLSVVCTDTYGQKLSAPVENGQATFQDLKPNTLYTVSVEVEGFHKLSGKLTESYTTPAETDIVAFEATTGNQEGSVILQFTVKGREPEDWEVVYWTEGEEEKTLSFTDHTITVTGLTPGKTYTFRLNSGSPVYLVGQNEITHTVIAPAYAKNLKIVSSDGDGLKVQWVTPEGLEGTSWQVHCYNESGYDQYITTQENSVVFTDTDPDMEYTVEVVADGMSTGSRTHVTKNAVRISNFLADTSDPTSISLSWDYAGNTPEGGWLVLYSVGVSPDQEVVRTDSATAKITPAAPGTTYHVTIQTANGVTVFDDSYEVNTPEAKNFDKYQVTADDFHFDMCLTPFEGDWSYTDLTEESYTTEFAVGQKASFLASLQVEYESADDYVTTQFLIKDHDGNAVSANSDTRVWSEMWYEGRCELDIPSLPEQPGEYTVELYFDGAYAGQQTFTVVAE